MPLALQALLPLIVLLLAAAVVRARRPNPGNGWIAAGATSVAALIALIELLRLAPGEHVDVPYVTTFPYADLLIRLDGLSLAFVTVTLCTAALLMVVRQVDRGDRRDPWTGWLLSSAVAAALFLAGNLLLLYILLQLLTLTWSGALDETAPRRRRLRLSLQVADIGLLLAAASAIQSVGTSSFSGVPSDTFGVASFWLMLLPVIVRIGALATGIRRPMSAVAFGPAIVWLAPAAYLLMRLLALMGGRLPDRPTAVILFVIASLAAVIFAGAALLTRTAVRMSSLLLAAQASVALALSTGSEPLLTVACTWVWLLLIPIAGVTSVRSVANPSADGLTRLQLAMIPGSLAFTGIWLGGLSLNARQLPEGMIPIAIALLLATLAARRGLARWTSADGRWGWKNLGRSFSQPATAWGVALLVIAAFPVIAMDPLALPAASTVRLVPPGTVTATVLGLSTSFGFWPALAVFVVGVGVLIGVERFAPQWLERWSALQPAPIVSLEVARAQLPRLPGVRRFGVARLPRLLLWVGFGVVLVVSIARP